MSKQQVNVGVGLHNKFHIEVTDAVTGKLVQEGFAENIVLDCGLSKLVYAFGTGSTLFEHQSSGDLDLQFGLLGGHGDLEGWNYSGACASDLQFGGRIFLGSGTTTPHPSQISLTTPVIHIPAVVVEPTVVSADQLSGTMVQQAVIGAGLRVGDVYREVGLGGGGGLNAATRISTRALIVDGNGDPLTITKEDLQVITITSTLYVQISHGYGPNLKFPGSATNADGASYDSTNALIGILMGHTKWGSGGYKQCRNAYTGTCTLCIGSDGTAPVQADSLYNNGGVKALITGGAIAAARQPNDNAKNVVYSARVPASVSGTIREIGFTIPVSRTQNRSLFRLALPIGSNSPTYDNVIADDHIDKTDLNVVDVSFKLQFGSL